MSKHCKKISACFALFSRAAGADEPKNPPPSTGDEVDLPPVEAGRGVDKISLMEQAKPPILPMPTERRWYGYQILIPAIACDLLAFNWAWLERDPAYALFPLMAHGAAGPIVHLAHYHSGRAGWSLLIESGGLLLGGLSFLVGFSMRIELSPSEQTRNAASIVFLTAAPVLLVTATVVDVAVLAYDDVPKEKVPKADVKVLPYVAPILPRDERTGERKPGISLGLAGYL